MRGKHYRWETKSAAIATDQENHDGGLSQCPEKKDGGESLFSWQELP